MKTDCLYKKILVFLVVNLVVVIMLIGFVEKQVLFFLFSDEVLIYF